MFSAVYSWAGKSVSIPHKIDVSNRKVFTTQKTNILSSQSDQNLGGVKMLEPRNKLRKDLSEKFYIKALRVEMY